MTPDDVRAAAEQLVDFHERFAPLFGKEQAQDHAYDYLKGLMVCPERKSIEPIALLVGHGDVSGLQKFIDVAPLGSTTTSRPRSRPSSPTSWSPRRPARRRRRRRHRRVGLRQEGDALRRRGAAAQRPARQGGQLPGRRLPGRGHPRGVGPAGPPALPARVLVRGHARGRAAAAAKAHIPEGRPSGTKPRIAAELVRDVAVLGAGRSWTGSPPTRSTARTGTSSTRWSELGQRYVVEVPVTTTVWTADPAVRAGVSGAASRRSADAGAVRRWPRWPRGCPPRPGRR